MKNKAKFDPLGDDADNGLGKEILPVIVGELTAVPAFIVAGGERAGYAFIEFFTAQIRNRNTRAAYAVAMRAFCAWCDAKGLSLGTLRTHHVAAYIEFIGRAYSPPTVKQHLAAIRMLFDWLVVRQVVEINPAAAVRGPKYVV
jgi:site-specific recombinase XerD